MADDSAPTVESTPTSPASSPEPAATSPASTGETSAPSPSAPPHEPTQGETREALLAHVQQAVPELRSSQDEEPPGGVPLAPASKSETGRYPDAAPSADGDLPEEVTPEEVAKYPPGTRRRVEKLLDQRRALRADVERLRALEPRAQQAEHVINYLRENDIGQEDFNRTLELAAAMRRGDFRTFYEGVKPYMQLAEEYLGVQLPQDLQQRVAEGHMTTQAARMFARERMDRALAEGQRTRQAEMYQQTTTAHAQQQLANSVEEHVDRWERATMAADPDYARKQAAVKDTMWAVVRENGRPQSPEHAVAIAMESYRRVNEHYRSWAPTARPTHAQPRSTGKTNGAAPEPKTLLEAVRIARESARA
jgi:hypothetical protein